MAAKKLLVLVTAAVFVLQGWMPVVHADMDASEPDTAETAVWEPVYEVSDGTETYVNPLYTWLTPEMLSFGEPDRGFQLLTAGTETVYYDTIGEAAEALREGIQNREATIRVGITQRLYTELSAAAVPHKEVFTRAYEHDPDNPKGGDYIRFTYGGWKKGTVESEQGVTLVYSFQYYSTAAEEAAVDARVEELTAAWKAMDMTEYQIVRTIYAYITENVTYDNAGLAAFQTAQQNGTLTMEHCDIFTAYKALLEGTAVCQGYANLFYRLALEMGIDARIIASIASENHAWNILQVGRWYYNIDATWDAENVDTGYRWFLLNEEEFSTKHTRRAEMDTDAFHQSHPMGAETYRGIGETVTGACGDSLTWTLVPAGVLTISGTGTMDDYVRAGDADALAPWMPWKTAITEVEVVPGPETIGEAAFAGMTEITGVSIAGTVEKIGALAFADCSVLQKVRFGGVLPAVDATAFLSAGDALVLYYPENAAGWESPAMTFSGTDGEGNAVSVTAAARSYQAKGDCSGDRGVTREDADLLTDYFAGYPVEIDCDAADVNGDGMLTRADAMILRRYLAGWAGYGKYFA